MLDNGIFLNTKDLMRLTGSNSYNSCGNHLRIIRASLADKKRKLTIKEYCEYEKIDFDYVWQFLRGKR